MQLLETVINMCRCKGLPVYSHTRTATYPKNADSIGELLNLADKALYSSKEIKNKVTEYENK